MSVHDVSAVQRNVGPKLKGAEMLVRVISVIKRIILTLILDSRMDPPGAGSCCPAPSLEKTSAATESSRDIALLNTGGDGGGISSFSSLGQQHASSCRWG